MTSLNGKKNLVDLLAIHYLGPFSVKNFSIGIKFRDFVILVLLIHFLYKVPIW